LLDEPTPSFAGVFTRNSFSGYPVQLGKKRLSFPLTRGVIVNNKVANVGSLNGDKDAERILQRLAEAVDADPEDFFSSSTGIVGWKLPVEEIIQAIPSLVANCSDNSILPFSKGIMTTDRFPKVRRASLGEGSIVAAAKGAGMIEPNMATMLCFVTTDVTIDRRELQQVLARVADRTFNRISVDGDQSTSDMVLAFSSRKKPEVAIDKFERALTDVLSTLSEDIVRNGEGTSHVIRVAVSGAQNEDEAVGVAKAVVNSPLVKTAIYGNDPNVGRILASIGDYLGNDDKELNLQKLKAKLGTTTVFSDGRFRLDFETEGRLSQYMKEAQFDPKLKGYPAHDRAVEIRVELGRGTAGAVATGSDLSYEYVRENADYRT
ncbi:MAG TPA: bifunctional glutamate N-acetyltransferase/amino-acid acetyltransferase ArgJ, partial [Spirochaetia bacterium]|nr:bifunctional glutamate N-acetyltransferase/amino-acid acetyltransferase ArgJ [Spirochaetia bacterium]